MLHAGTVDNGLLHWSYKALGSRIGTEPELRFVLINTDYPEFTNWLYTQNPGLEDRPYEEQMRVRAQSLFGVADFYSTSLAELGHEAWDIHVNNHFMQRAWTGGKSAARLGDESSVSRKLRASIRQTLRKGSHTPLRHLGPFVRPLVRWASSTSQSWSSEVLVDQIKRYDPDIVLNFALGSVSGSALRRKLPRGRLLVGQIASPLPGRDALEGYDLILSSLPNFVAYFKKLGLRSELQRLAFEPRVLGRLRNLDRTIPVSFVGSVSQAHTSRAKLIEHLCQLEEFEVWGQLERNMGTHSSIPSHYEGPAWGVEMYEILSRSRVTINHHIDVAESYANNMRLFEATGVGALLLTDWKRNLSEMFEPGKEVVTYRTTEECSELVTYYLEHTEERDEIARAGQQRTLRDHTYGQRTEELLNILTSF